MPGPRQKKQIVKRRANDALQSLTPDAGQSCAQKNYLIEIDRAESWNKIVDILCSEFGLPDMTTRSGLKKIHANFATIYKRLEDVWLQSPKNERITGGIIGIYGKMCSDWLLRNQLLEKGLVDKTLPLLEIEATRHVALRVLAAITHHGGVDVRLEIAVHANKLISYIETFQDDSIIADLVISTVSHSLAAVFDRDSDLPLHVVSKLDMPTILKVTTETTKKEWADASLIHHAILLLTLSTLHTAPACRLNPPVERLLVAGLRSNNWVVRCTCLGGIIRRYRHEAENDLTRILDPNRLMNRARMGFKPNLQKQMEEFGLYRCETFIIIRTCSEYQDAMYKALETKDLAEFGLKVAEFIPRTEWCVFEGTVFDGDPRSGGKRREDTGLPFQRWTESLPYCAQAIRARRDPKLEEKAYMLLVKSAILNRLIPDAVKLAYKALEQFPENAYFYYAISLSGDMAEALRGAKKGLRLRYMTPFLRTRMLQRAVNTAAYLGIQILQDCGALGLSRFGEGVAMLTGALEDAKAFLEIAAPDNRLRNAVLYWQILLSIVIQGPTMDLNLDGAKSALDAQKVADDFFEDISIEPPMTELRHAQKSIVKLYVAASKEFGGVIARAEHGEEPTANANSTEDYLATWLDDTHNHHGNPDPDMHIMPPEFNDNAVELYRCSDCGNPSAVLRKCSRCSKARYCDAKCQKNHWKEHKKVCSP